MPTGSTRAGFLCQATWVAVTACAAVAAASARAEPPATPAPAAPVTVDAEVFVILAAHEEGPPDPALDGMPALRKSPFDTFKSMKLLSRTALKLDTAKAVTVDLPNGRQLRLSLIERLPDGRHRVDVSINRPKEKDYLPLLQMIASSEPFFVAGQKFEGKTLVIGVRVGAKPAK